MFSPFSYLHFRKTIPLYLPLLHLLSETLVLFGHFQTKTFQTSSGSGWAGEASATGAAQVRSRVGRAGAGFDAFRAKTLSTGSGGDWAGEAAAPGAAHVRSGVGRAGIWFGALRAGTLLGGSGGGSFGRLLVCLAPVLPWRGRAPPTPSHPPPHPPHPPHPPLPAAPPTPHPPFFSPAQFGVTIHTYRIYLARVDPA